MGLVPEFLADNGFVLAGIGDAFVHGIANVDPVVEELVQHALVEQVAVSVLGAGQDQFASQQRRRFQMDERRWNKEMLDRFRHTSVYAAI
jgi:hypothetical protein